MTGAEIVIDSGPLSVFAEAGWLGMLRAIADDRTVVVTDIVEAELRDGAPLHPHLTSVLEAQWIQRRPLVSDDELVAYQRFASFLVSGDHNRGEASVLAYAQVHGAVAVLDDGAGRKHAKRCNIEFQGTLALLCEAIRRGDASVEMISRVADHMLETEYRLPFGPGGFANWAKEHGLVPPI
jgi:predicted nucleic acid-binding protein